MKSSATHEDLTREKPGGPGSERSFAIVIAVALTMVAGVNFWHAGRVWPGLALVAGLLLLAGYFAPALLRPLNWAWFRFGLLLHAVINPIIMGAIFYGAVLPTGLVMRARGSDLLRLRREPDGKSYWIAREPPGPAPDTMKDQF
jgi:hypothetical protein